MSRIDLDSKHLHGELAGGVLTVVLDRPERKNACTIEMYHGIKKAAVMAGRDDAIDVLVLTGRGDVFCVGGEMGGKHEAGDRLDRETDGLDLLPFLALERCPKIVVVAVNGLCQGGGVNMMLMSDVAIASDRAEFRTPELLRGVADCFLSARLAARVGVARAKYLLFAARSISAAEAGAMGLVSRVVPHAELERAVAETVGWIRETGPEARSTVKADLNRHLPPIDHVMFAESLRSEEVKEGFQAFVEKRPPRWVKR